MKQITIVSEDRLGVVTEICEALAAARVNIESLDAETIGASGVTKLTVDRYDDALRALAQTPFHAISEEAIVLQLEDKPGELARISRRFKDANISMRSVRIIRRATGISIVAISAERTKEAMELVKDVMIS